MTITLTDRLTEHFKIIESLTGFSSQSEGNTPNPFIKICTQTHARLLYCCSSQLLHEELSPNNWYGPEFDFC